MLRGKEIFFGLFLILCTKYVSGEQIFGGGFDPEHLSRERERLEPLDQDTAKRLSGFPDALYSESLLQGAALNLSDRCELDVAQVSKDLNVSIDYALRMVDSAGKPGAGILDGNVVWFGAYEQCKAVSNNQAAELLITGQYCMPTIVKGLFTIYRFGVCVPDSCNETDVQALTLDFIKRVLGSEWKVSDVSCAEALPWRLGDTIMVVVLVLFAVLVICSTGYEIYIRRRGSQKQDDLWAVENKGFETEGQSNGIKLQSVKAENVTIQHVNGSTGSVTHQGDMNGLTSSVTHHQGDMNGSTTVPPQQDVKSKSSSQTKNDFVSEILSAFSVTSNVRQLVRMTGTPAGMEALNGMRVISLAWVILGHTYIIVWTFASNPNQILADWSSSITFQFIYQAPVAVDTFFFLSGFLVAFGTLKVLKKTRGRLNWALFYLNRYLRLTPVYMLVLFLWITIIYHLIQGPYENMDLIAPFGFDYCYEYWWTNLLYINNFYPVNFGEMCFNWSWYLANDMQFFLVSPFFIYAMYRSRKLGHAMVWAGILSNLMAVGIIFNKYKLADPLDFSVDRATRQKYTDNMYIRPYYRIAPYLVGIACADIYMNTKDTVRNMKATWWKVFVMLMWMAAIALNLSLLYGFYPYESNPYNMGPLWLQELYWSTFRLVWALTCAWVAYACMTGWGGFVNTILSLRVWEPLTRLSYLAYLLHPAVQALFMFNLQENVRFNHWILALMFAGFMGIVLALSLLLSLLVEQPLGRLQKHFLKK